MNYTPSNVDRNVSSLEIPRFLGLRNMAGSLAVSNVFATFQGEMPFAGRPAVFVRLAGCNRGAKIDCPFCDTEFSLHNAQVMTPGMLVNEVLSKHMEHNTEDLLVVISGGEPTLQTEGLKLFCEELIAVTEGITHLDVQFETNGDYLDKLVDFTARDVFTVVVSPKANKRTGYNEKIGDEYRELMSDETFVRCVVSADPEDPYHQIPDWVKEIPPSEVFLSPITVYNQPVDHTKVVDFWGGDLIDRERTGANYAHARQLAMKHSFGLSMQTHLLFNLE